MGVYTRLYAPIFNYIHMSQAEKTNTSDTSKKPRLYDRGNDQINLDDYIRNLESGFDAWLNSRKIKDKHKEAVREAYREMVARINSGDGSFTSRLGGGFQDSTGRIKNADKGFDAAGVAASYLGRTLRGMDIYKEPEPTPDPSKIKYGDGAIGTALTRRLLGSAGTIQDFIDRDRYENGTRTNINRSKDFRSALESLANDWEAGTGEFFDFTDEQRTQGLKDIRNLFTIFDNDGQITDDEYLQLARVTGMSNLRQMFATGEQTAPTVTAHDGTVQRSGRTHRDKIRAIQDRWGKPYTGEMISPITIGKYDMSRLGPDASEKLTQALNSASAQDLVGIIQDILGFENRTALNTRFISKVFNGDNPFVGSTEENVRNFLLGTAIDLLGKKTADHNGGLHNFGESNLGAYYIGGTQTGRGTGFVYDSNNRTISEMSIHSIPYWQKYINNWWDTLEDSNDDLDPTLTFIYKKGGVLYAHDGTVMDRDSGRGSMALSGPNPWLNVSNTSTNANTTEIWGNYYKLNEILNHVKQFIQNDFNASPWNKSSYRKKDDFGDIIVDDSNNVVRGQSLGQLGVLLNKLNKEGANLNWDLDAIDDSNKQQYEKWNQLFDQSGFNYYFGGDSDKFKSIGPSTYSRYLFLQELQKAYGKDNPLGGNNGIYWDGRRWQLSGSDLTTPKIPKIKVTPPDPSTIKIAPIGQTPTQSDNSVVDEEDPGAQMQSSGRGSNFLNTAASILPGLLGGATRLGLSLRANKKIEKALQPHIALHEPLNIHKRILGDFATRQNYHRYGAEALSQANRQADADADRNAARMHEAQRLNIESQIKGDLADNTAIQKSLDEKFNLNKWLLQYNRENTYEPNRGKIANYWNTVGQIRASRLGKDWKGIDNFIAELQGRIDNKREALYDIAKDDARTEMENAIEPYQTEFRNWLSDPKNSDITKHPKYLDYLDTIRNSRNTYTQRVNQAALYYARQGGKIKPKQQDFISQIVKLNNERNS